MKKLLILSFLTLIFLFSPRAIFAKAGDISNFDTKIVAHKDGTMDVTETITYELKPTEKHGLLRNIPLVSKVGDLYRVISISVKSAARDNQKEKYSVSYADNQIIIKIGDAGKTISGSHTFTINYTVKNGIGSNFPDHDEIFWNTTGDNWPGLIEKATATIDTDFGAVPNGAKCFTGAKGSTESTCSLPAVAGNPYRTNRPLRSGEGMSIVYSFPAGTFPKSTLQKNPPSALNYIFSNPIFIGTILVSWFLINILASILLWRWYQGKKSKKRFGPPTVNFDFPVGYDGGRLSPAEAGIMDTARIEKDDVIATIYDLAIRKFIRLDNEKKDIKVIGIDVGDKDDFIITKLNDYSNANPFEKRLLDRLFQDGDSVHLDTLKTDFYKTFSELETDAFNSLVDRGFYTKNPKTQKVLLVMGAFMALVAASPLLALVLFYIAKKYIGRTEAGDEADFKIDGLKLFLSGRSREYTWNAQNLQVVEKMIPYAMSLGFIKEFMKQFQTAYPDYQPSWYSGYQPFYLGFYGFGNSFNSNFTTSAPSSSSGMGGGGFSGGGGGGGGGGGW